MTAGRLRTSVVIATYNRCSRLPALIAPLLAERATHEIVVVVDGCRDGSLEVVENFATEDPRVIAVYQENRGAAAARAAGVQRATGEIVLLLDDDVVPEPGLVAGHTAHHARREGRVVVGYMPVVETRQRTNLAARLYAAAYEDCCRAWDKTPSAILTSLWAGQFSMWRKDALRIGLDGSERFNFNADWDFGIRCRGGGLHGVFDRTLRSPHDYARTLPELVRDAYHQGRDLTILHMIHPDVMGPLRRDRFTAWLPRPLRGLVEFCRRPRMGRMVTWALMALANVAGWLRFKRLQEGATVVIIRIARQRGAIDLRQQRLEAEGASGGSPSDLTARTVTTTG